MKFPESINLVYSTDPSTLLESQEKQELPAPSGDGIVRLHRQTKGIKSKGITRITGLPLTQTELKKLCGTLKKKCGCGGRVQEFEVHLQTQDREKIKGFLEAMNYQLKIAGG